MYDESFKFFDPPTTKWRPFKFFAKLNRNHILMVNFSKLRKYTFGLIELHNLSKGQLPDRIFKLWKSCVYDYRGPSNIQLLKFWFFNFSNFQTTFVKNFMKKVLGFKISFKVLPIHQYLWSEISRQWTMALWIFFRNLHRRAFCFLNFVKWGKYQSFNFPDTSKMYYCGLF